MKEAVDRHIGIMDDNGVVVACSDLSKIGETNAEVLDEISYSFDTAVWEGYTYRPIGSHARIEFLIFVEGDDEKAREITLLLSISFTNIKSLYD